VVYQTNSGIERYQVDLMDLENEQLDHVLVIIGSFKLHPDLTIF
jgi:hypothetical protein